MRSDNSLFDMESYRVCFLSPEDIPALDALCHRCSDYYIMVTGSPPGPDSGYDLYFDLPPGRTDEGKILIGIFDGNDNMVSIVDIVKDYPDKNISFIGLMMIDPFMRRKGIGEMIINRIAEWLSHSGVKEIQLGVVRQNKKALKFWKKVGFVEIGEKTMEIAAEKFLNVVKMRMIINPVENQKESNSGQSVF